MTDFCIRMTNSLGLTIDQVHAQKDLREPEAQARVHTTLSQEQPSPDVRRRLPPRLRFGFVCLFSSARVL